ncbi:tripeptidyl peptidase A [Lactarius vividus]|nr:tripeptidyl peptidase A [Lactarius vividus]
MRSLFFCPTVFVALVLGALQSSLAAPGTSHPNANTPRLKESVPPPHDWIDLGRAPPARPIPLRIALPQTRFDELERHLYESSDPYHARYGQHLLKEQVEELVRPPRHSVDAVHAWLTQYGITGEMVRRSPAGDWITVTVPILLAEAMLDTEFHLWKHAVEDNVLVRTTQYSLPEHLHAHIDLVQPTTYFGHPKAMGATFHFNHINISLAGLLDVSIDSSPVGNNGSPVTPVLTDPHLGTNCTDVITVSCLLQLYNAASYRPAATDKNSIGITGYLEEFANVADLQTFYASERLDAVGSTFKTVLVNGGQNPQDTSLAGPEADLDTQFGFGLAYPTPGTFYSTGGRPPFIPDATIPDNTNEPYDDWLQFMLALSDKDIPRTISTSYGEHEQTVPKDYAVRVCKEFAKLSCRGVSIIFASGDFGAGDGNPDPGSQQCFTNDGNNRTQFLPSFPASCPFVTAVGGTKLIPEVAAEFSGGGFSNYFARPSYQDGAVRNYLSKLGNKYSGLYNSRGRAYPDVSAQSDNFLIFWQGRPGLIAGTSASAPTFAGIVALLNDAQLAAGKPSLGFLNPMLYSMGVPGFNDVTSGNAPGCGTPGFNALQGWDPVTGLGTPDFGKLKAILSRNYLPPPSSLGGLLVNVLSFLLDISISLQLKLL